MSRFVLVGRLRLALQNVFRRRRGELQRRLHETGRQCAFDLQLRRRLQSRFHGDAERLPVVTRQFQFAALCADAG